MILFIGDLFGKMFGGIGKTVASAAETKAKQKTVGKAQGKMMKAQADMQQKALRSMDKVGPGMGKKGDGGDAAAANNPYAPPPVNPGMAQLPPQAVAAPEQRQMGQLTCPNGHPIDPSWEVCPYCRSAAQQGVSAVQVQPMGSGAPAKTMAINVAELTGSQHTNKAVVGWIVCMKGEQKGQDFRLYDGRNVLGTAADCDIVVFDPYLSARHCVFLIESSKCTYVLQDLDSRNGTYVNRQRIMKQELIDNDEIRLGQAEFRFKALF